MGELEYGVKNHFFNLKILNQFSVLDRREDSSHIVLTPLNPEVIALTLVLWRYPDIKDYYLLPAVRLIIYLQVGKYKNHDQGCTRCYKVTHKV